MSDASFDFLERAATGGDRPDKRKGNIARLIDRIGVGQIFLLEYRDAQSIAGIEAIAFLQSFMKCRGSRLIGRGTAS